MQKYAGGGPCISEGHTDMDKDNKGCQTQNCYNEHINNIKHKNHLNVKKEPIYCLKPVLDWEKRHLNIQIFLCGIAAKSTCSLWKLEPAK